ncbi:tetratricopeptide repeat protein [Streptomyces mesophilus]|nr:helix-turn-helix transcriptional regulator [Streptomyces mesophilus]
MRAAITGHDFGTVFRLARELGNISYSKIAAECDIKPERVGQLARGQGQITTFDKIVKIADSLRIPGHLLGLAPRYWEVPAAPGGAEYGESVRRRDFLKKTSLTAGAAIGLNKITDAPMAGSRLGPEAPDYLRRRTARLRRLDDVLGGGDTYRVYLAEYQSTKALLRDRTYSLATGRALRSVLAEQGLQAGWAAFDAGKPDDARGLYLEAQQAAQDADDRALAGNALAFLAYQHPDRHQAVALAEASCRIAADDQPGEVRALLHERYAWSCALAGRALETEQALETAASAIAELDQPTVDWAAWVDTDELDIMRGRCWTELRRPLRAVPVLEGVLDRFKDSHARDKSLYMSWLAQSYLAAGEIEQAATVTSRALTLCTGVASVRPRRRLDTVLHELSSHAGVPEVRDALERARS